jgi:hypothetical protein
MSFYTDRKEPTQLNLSLLDLARQIKDPFPIHKTQCQVKLFTQKIKNYLYYH